jgi:hypothetical protein
MTLTDLIEQLQDLMEEFPELAEADVMVAQQPSYPLSAVIDCISLVDNDSDEDEDDGISGGLPVVWIATSEVGSNSKVSPYAPRAAWEGR